MKNKTIFISLVILIASLSSSVYSTQARAQNQSNQKFSKSEYHETLDKLLSLQEGRIRLSQIEQRANEILVDSIITQVDPSHKSSFSTSDIQWASDHLNFLKARDFNAKDNALMKHSLNEQLNSSKSFPLVQAKKQSAFSASIVSNTSGLAQSKPPVLARPQAQVIAQLKSQVQAQAQVKIKEPVKPLVLARPPKAQVLAQLQSQMLAPLSSPAQRQAQCLRSFNSEVIIPQNTHLHSSLSQIIQSPQMESLEAKEAELNKENIPPKDLVLAITPQGEELQFEKINVPGDGDCAFHALAKDKAEEDKQINRKAFLQQILEHKKDRNLRALFSGELPWRDINAPVQSVTPAVVASEDLFAQYMSQHMSQKAYFLGFTPQYHQNQKLVDDNMGSLAALAQLNGLNVRIWQDNGSNPKLALTAEFVNSDLKLNPYRDIYLNGRSSHFQKLSLIAAPSKVNP